jgi:hypothetical protein
MGDRLKAGGLNPMMDRQSCNRKVRWVGHDKQWAGSLLVGVHFHRWHFRFGSIAGLRGRRRQTY